MVSTVKLCPNCGRLPKFDYVPVFPPKHYLICDCGFKSGEFDDKDDAIDDWNDSIENYLAEMQNVIYATKNGVRVSRFRFYNE